jgi:hypothetical protein
MAARTTAKLIWDSVLKKLLITNAVYIPMSRLIVVSHSLGWLARLSVTAICVVLVMRA